MPEETDYLLFLKIKTIGIGWVFWVHFKSPEATNDSAKKLISQEIMQIQDWKVMSVDQIVGETSTEE